MNQGLTWIWRHELATDDGVLPGAVRLWREARPVAKVARGWAVWEPPRDVALGGDDVFANTGVGLSAWIDGIDPAWLWVSLHDGVSVSAATGAYPDPSGGGGVWLYAGGAGAKLDVARGQGFAQVRWGAALVLAATADADDVADRIEASLREAVDAVVGAWLDGQPASLTAAVARLVDCRIHADRSWRLADGRARARIGSRLLAADVAVARLGPWVRPWMPVPDPRDDGRGWWTGDGFPAFGPRGETP